MSEPVVQEWVDRNDLRWEGDKIVSTEKTDEIGNPKRIADFSKNQNGPIVFHRDGDMALQGEPIGVKDEWLHVDGTRHAWDQGPVEFEGEFAVMMHRGYPEIDGPLP